MNYIIKLEVECNAKMTSDKVHLLGEHLKDVIYDDQDEFETVKDVTYDIGITEDKE